MFLAVGKAEVWKNAGASAATWVASALKSDGKELPDILSAEAINNMARDIEEDNEGGKAQPLEVEGVKKQVSSRPVWNRPSLGLNVRDSSGNAHHLPEIRNVYYDLGS